MLPYPLSVAVLCIHSKPSRQMPAQTPLALLILPNPTSLNCHKLPGLERAPLVGPYPQLATACKGYHFLWKLSSLLSPQWGSPAVQFWIPM